MEYTLKGSLSVVSVTTEVHFGFMSFNPVLSTEFFNSTTKFTPKRM